jgi:S-methylmethionine-dependent homocysteine/selenocysteine methylase
MSTPLPHLTDDRLYLTDGGLETSLIFHQGIALEAFAAFPLLEDEEGRTALRDYFAPYLATAREHGAGFLLDTPTWRANADWGAQLGYDAEALERVNVAAVSHAQQLLERTDRAPAPVLMSGVIGPRGDGYQAGAMMSAAKAEAYHAAQVESLAAAGVDLVAAITMTYPDEAVGIARAAAEAGVPAVISFTVETDGRLPDGCALGDAIEQVDTRTRAAPAYYMVNCAHPSHFAQALDAGAEWTDRIVGLRANASTLSHAELDEAEELDEGDPAALAADYVALRPRLRNLRVLGGCCGTDARHVAAVAAAWVT